MARVAISEAAEVSRGVTRQGYYIQGLCLPGIHDMSLIVHCCVRLRLNIEKKLTGDVTEGEGESIGF